MLRRDVISFHTLGILHCFPLQILTLGCLYMRPVTYKESPFIWAPVSGDHQAAVREDFIRVSNVWLVLISFLFFSFVEIELYIFSQYKMGTQAFLRVPSKKEKVGGREGQGAEFCLDPIALAQQSCWDRN